MYFQVVYSPCVQSQKPPRSLPWLTWADGLMFTHLVNMTGELIADTTYKLRQAEKIKDMHGGSVTFELGFIAAGLQERFHRMLEIYRKYADLKDLKAAKYTMWELLNAYHVIQGDYNEIRLEKSIFYEIVRKQESAEATSKLFRGYTGFTDATSARSLPPGLNIRPSKRRAMTWRPNTEMFYDFPANKKK